MNKSLLVEIFVSFNNNEMGEIATGYPIAPNRILTARHVLFPEGSKQPVKIQVRWHFLKDKGSEYDWQAATLIDCGLADEMDVALLECPFPEGISSAVNLMEKNPQQEFGWESEGFPKVGKRDDRRDSVELSGTALSAEDKKQRLALANIAPVADDELWQGASGAPVFKKNSTMITGVIITCPTGFKAARLHATPTWRLLENRKFRDAIEYDIREDRRETVCKEIEKRLLQSKEVYDALKKSSTKSHKEVAKIIVALPVLDLLELFDAAITLLLSQDKRETALDVRELAYFILPCIFDQRIIDALSSKPEYEICAVPVATTTVAEIIMAGVDKRPLAYIFQDDLHEELCGENNLINHLLHAPNLGICGDSEHVKTASDHLVNKYCGISDLTKKEKTGRSRLIKRAAGELKRLSQYASQTLYCVYDLSENATNREHLKSLKKDFPSLVLIEMSSTTQDEDDEFETYFLLRKIHTTII